MKFLETFKSDDYLLSLNCKIESYKWKLYFSTFYVNYFCGVLNINWLSNGIKFTKSSSSMIIALHRGKQKQLKKIKYNKKKKKERIHCQRMVMRTMIRVVWILSKKTNRPPEMWSFGASSTIVLQRPHLNNKSSKLGRPKKKFKKN